MFDILYLNFNRVIIIFVGYSGGSSWGTDRYGGDRYGGGSVHDRDRFGDGNAGGRQIKIYSVNGFFKS